MTMIARTEALAASAEPARMDAPQRLELLFNAHHQRLYRLARRLSPNHDDARDLVQETFLRAAQKPRSVPAGASNEEAWLVRVLINLCRDRWRQRAVHQRLQPVAGTPATTRSDEAATVARATIWKALERLSPRRRAVVIMGELEGLSIPSIAKMLGVNAVTVRWHLSRGRRELAHIVGTQGSEASSREE